MHPGFRWLIVGQVWVVGLLTAPASAAIQITGISPGYGWNSTTINATITGTRFLPDSGVDVKLTR